MTDTIIEFRVRYTRHDRPGETITIPRRTRVPELAAKMLRETVALSTIKDAWIEQRERRPWTIATDGPSQGEVTGDCHASPDTDSSPDPEPEGAP